MSSFTRTIGKRIALKFLTAEQRQERKDSKAQTFRQHEDGIGYDVLHPTRGWRRVCARRVIARLGAVA